jgi:hypothetical protein
MKINYSDSTADLKQQKKKISNLEDTSIHIIRYKGQKEKE